MFGDFVVRCDVVCPCGKWLFADRLHLHPVCECGHAFLSTKGVERGRYRAPYQNHQKAYRKSVWKRGSTQTPEGSAWTQPDRSGWDEYHQPIHRHVHWGAGHGRGPHFSSRAEGMELQGQSAMLAEWAKRMEHALEQVLLKLGEDPSIDHVVQPLQALLQEVQPAVEGEAAALPAHVEVARKLKDKAGQLRDLGNKKIQQQLKVDSLREQLKSQEQKLQSLQDELQQCQVEMDQVCQQYGDLVVSKRLEPYVQPDARQVRAMDEEQLRELLSTEDGQLSQAQKQWLLQKLYRKAEDDLANHHKKRRTEESGTESQALLAYPENPCIDDPDAYLRTGHG